jgi:uncharacterized protein (TIGR00725 family)
VAERLLVAIIGSGTAASGSPAWTDAYEVAHALACAGVVVLCGGRGGVMAAACQGVSNARGISIAILPRLDPGEANPYATIVLPTDLGDVRTPICRAPEVSRNRVIASAARCLVAVGGGPGTANEIAHALRFGRTVFGICDAPEPEPPVAEQAARSGRYVRLGSAAEAARQVLDLLATQ